MLSIYIFSIKFGFQMVEHRENSKYLAISLCLINKSLYFLIASLNLMMLSVIKLIKKLSRLHTFSFSS